MSRPLFNRTLLLLAAAALLSPPPADGQWTNRYPRLDGYGHHVYLEGYELPTLSTGVMDPAPAPDGRHLAFSSRGWIWVMDLTTRTASRLTRGGDMDFRPSWSPDGSRIALVRDSGAETWIVVVDASSGDEVRTVRSPAIELDPVFSPDGGTLYFSSAREGTLDLWSLDLGSGEETRLTTERGIQLRPQVHPDGTHLLYLSKAGGRDQVRMRNLATSGEQVLVEASIASQARPALSPDGRTVALNWPVAEGWELRLMDITMPTLPIYLTRGGGLPLAPAWSPDGAWIYFVHSTPDGTMALFRIAAAGGEAEELTVRRWDWGETTGRIRVTTAMASQANAAGGSAEPSAGASAASVPGAPSATPTRLNVRDAQGHPALPDRGQPRFDGQNGEVFFYSSGVVELEVPAGEITVTAVQGMATPAVRRTVTVTAGGVTDVDLELEPLWNAAEEGFLSGEHHFHLNYGGPFLVRPETLDLQMQGEALDAASPLLANLHNRFGERDFWGERRAGNPPFLEFGQEVRSHFLGHVALVGIQDLFWPWIWGPGYPVHAGDDRPNADPMRFARDQGGMGTYVHPVSGRDPFAEGAAGMIPVGFIPDAVLGDLDAIELVCLWTDPLGSAELWYRVLNVGIPLAATAGSDVMTDFYRTMAIGSTRVFVQTGERHDWATYLDGLRAGRSFVTTGPYLQFMVSSGDVEGAPSGGGAGEAQEGADGWVHPGETVPAGRVRWQVDLRSPTAVDALEIVVNGQVVQTEGGLDAPGRRIYRGEVDLPEGGWIAARAHGGPAAWPVMAAYPFAHSSPVWIETRGSTDPTAAARSAGELLAALDVAEARLRIGYQGFDIPRLQGRFDAARQALEGHTR